MPDAGAGESSRTAHAALASLLLTAPLALPAHSAPPRVASINLCADQLVLDLADPGQILTVSWLAADSNESAMADRARRVPLNYGTAEELLHYAPDVVIAGTLTGQHTRALLTRLGYTVVELPPADSLAGIERNVRLVADAVGQPARGELRVQQMTESVRTFERSRPPAPIDAVVVRPGGFTVGAHELANELMSIAGLSNVAAAQGLDRWGSLSMETLARSTPQLLIFTGYRAGDASLANAVLDHPALDRLKQRVRSVTVPTAYWACGLPQSLESVSLMRAGTQG